MRTLVQSRRASFLEQKFRQASLAQAEPTDPHSTKAPAPLRARQAPIISMPSPIVNLWLLGNFSIVGTSHARNW